MRFELKEILTFGVLLVSITVAFVTVQQQASSLHIRVEKLEKLELNQLSGRVDRLSCRISQLRKQLLNQLQIDCPE